jgi:hypothetical protein
MSTRIAEARLSYVGDGDRGLARASLRGGHNLLTWIGL